MNDTDKIAYIFPFLVLSGVGWLVITGVIDNMGYPRLFACCIGLIGVLINYAFYAIAIDRINLK